MSGRVSVKGQGLGQGQGQGQGQGLEQGQSQEKDQGRGLSGAACGGAYESERAFWLRQAESHFAEADLPSALPDPCLTPRQRQVLGLIVDGQSNKLIARSLGLGEGTVKIHVAAVLRALGVPNRSAAAVIGARIAAGA